VKAFKPTYVNGGDFFVKTDPVSSAVSVLPSREVANSLLET
jgi:hypothetical protein